MVEALVLITVSPRPGLRSCLPGATLVRNHFRLNVMTNTLSGAIPTVSSTLCLRHEPQALGVRPSLWDPNALTAHVRSDADAHKRYSVAGPCSGPPASTDAGRRS
jgi:hypothetical protein